MPKRTRLLGAATVGAALVLTVPMAAHAQTAPSLSSATTALSTPTSALPTSALPTPALPTSSVPAPLSQVLAPSASDTGNSTVTTAPAGQAEAYAANVAGAIVVSHTKASASGSGTSSTANPLELGGAPPAAQFGGTQTGPGTSSNSLADTGPNSMFRLELTPWSATNSQSGDESNAIADILTLALGDQSTSQSASVYLLQSTSNASWNPSQSTAKSSSDGAIITAGGPSGLNLDVLHSDTSSTGTGSSYLLSINGTEIGSSGQVNGQCVIPAAPLLNLVCLSATGGTANGVTTTAADVAQVLLGPGGAATVGLIHSSTSSGPAGTASGSGGLIGSSGGSGSGGGGSTSPAGSSGSVAAAGSGSLPFTGFNVIAATIVGLLLALAGAGLVLIGRRRGSAAVIG